MTRHRQKAKMKGNNRKQAKGTAEGAQKGSEGKEEDPKNISEENECGEKSKQEEERRHTLNRNQRRKLGNGKAKKSENTPAEGAEERKRHEQRKAERQVNVERKRKGKSQKKIRGGRQPKGEKEEKTTKPTPQIARTNAQTNWKLRKT